MGREREDSRFYNFLIFDVNEVVNAKRWLSCLSQLAFIVKTGGKFS